MPGSQVAYTPSDPIQTAFLSALALGETGNNPNSATEGFGSVSTANDATDQYGFPIFGGSSTSAGPTHAAGTFQFEPGTWDKIASEFGLNFANPADQDAGAWYEAQQTYASATGGQSLETALQSGNYSSVQSALASVWPSVLGNAASPSGLAGALAGGNGATLPGASVTPSSTSSGSSSTSLIGTVESFFVRSGLIILGGLVIVVSLWALLAQQGVVPGPVETAKAGGKALAHAATEAAVAA